jgi:mannosyltransferase OCH1-like enzyme
VIPKKLHFIWIGDESKMPKGCIDTWISKNPDYEVKMWGNDSLKEGVWRNWENITDMLRKKDYAGASDIMRYQILEREGGIYVDADSYCIKPLEDWLLDCEAFACWEQERIRNNLISNGLIGGVPNALVWKRCSEEIGNRDCKEEKLAWLITGPMLLSELYFKEQLNLTVYPSHFFMPEHHTGYKNNTTGHRFATHLWGSEIGYDSMDKVMEEKHAGDNRQ